MTTAQRYNKELQESPNKKNRLYKVNQWNVFKRDVEFGGDIISDFVCTTKLKFPDYKDFGEGSFTFKTENAILAFCTHSSENPLRYTQENVFVSRGVESGEKLYCSRESDDPIFKRILRTEHEGNCIIKKVGVKNCVIAKTNIPKGTILLLTKNK